MEVLLPSVAAQPSVERLYNKRLSRLVRLSGESCLREVVKLSRPEPVKLVERPAISG
jgi:hypothetical protein